jgi:hypothetical protein
MLQKSLAALLVIGLVSAARAGTPADSLRTAVAKGLRRVEQGAAHYLDKRCCFSCHHQALPLLTISLAPKLGYSVEPASLKKQLDRTVGFFRPNALPRAQQEIRNREAASSSVKSLSAI